MTPSGYLHYDKRHLFSLAGEEKTYSNGKDKILPTLNGWKILPLICYDLRFPVWSRRTTNANYDLLLYVANWPDKRANAWKQLLPARAIENQSYTVGLNRYGNDGNGIFYSGDSCVVDFKGDLLEDSTGEGEYSTTLTLSMEEQNTFREHFAFFNDRDDFEILP